MSNYIDNIVKNAVTYDLVSKPLANDMANEFSIQSTYAVGDYVMHDYKLYKCISAVTTAGNWNSAKWQECKIGDELNGGVKFTAQTLTSEQKAQTRANIGAISQEEATPDAIRYSAQSLTEAQKNQTRLNVGTVASTSIAEEFSTSMAYAVGDLVMYNSKLYKFKTAHSAGAWNNAQVDAVSVKEEISSLSNDLNVLEPSATSSDVGKTLKVKTVSDGKVTEYEFGESSGSGSVRYDTAQSLTDAQKLQAKTNIGVSDTDDVELIVVQGEVAETSRLFTADDIIGAEQIEYSFDVGHTSNYYQAGYMSLYATDGTRIAVIGRGSTGNTTVHYSGTQVIPSNFSYAEWNCYPDSAGTFQYIKTRISVSDKIDIVDTRLTNSVETVKETLEEIESEYFLTREGEKLPNAVLNNGHRLTDTGIDSTNTAYKLLRYPVVAGTTIKVISDDRFQFQPSIDLPSSLPSPRIGQTYGEYNGDIVVPEGATYVALSTPLAAGIGKVEYAETVTAVDKAVRVDISQEFTQEEKAQAKENLGIGESGTEDILYKGTANNDQILFRASDLGTATRIQYSFDVNHASNYYPAGYMAFYDSNDTRLMWMGRASTVQTVTRVRYEGEVDIPDGFSYAKWITVQTPSTATPGTATFQYIKPIYKNYNTIDNLYARYAIHEYGTYYNNFPHVAFARMCAFDNKIVLIYRCGQNHGGYEAAVAQIDTIEMDGTHKHVKTLKNTDFGTDRLDGRDWYCSCSPDGNYLVLYGGFATPVGDGTVNVDTVIACLDKNFNVLNYNVTTGLRDFSYGNILFTPNGKIIQSYFNQSLTDAGIRYSNEVFNGDVSNLTFEKITLFTPSNTGASQFSECCLGYFNDSLLIALRLDTMNEYTPFRITTDLEGLTGWGEVSRLQGSLSHSPVLLPYYRGKYLPFMCSKRNVSTGNRVPYFAFVDLENMVIICGDDIDKTLLPAPSGYPWFVRLFDETYAVSYYQEVAGGASVQDPNLVNTALYFRVINARLLFPQLDYYDWTAEIPSGN